MCSLMPARPLSICIDPMLSSHPALDQSGPAHWMLGAGEDRSSSSTPSTGKRLRARQLPAGNRTACVRRRRRPDAGVDLGGFPMYRAHRRRSTRRAPARGRTGFEIEAERVASNHAAVAEMQPDSFQPGDSDSRWSATTLRLSAAPLPPPPAVRCRRFAENLARLIECTRPPARARGRIEIVIPARGWHGGP